MIAHLTDRAAVRVSGPDARGLLHNVLTLDMGRVDEHGSGYGALLTPQGKILWDFILHRLPDGYAADVRADQAEAFARRLGFYKLRAKVDIAVTPELRVHVAWPDGGGRTADPRLVALGGRWIAAAGTVTAGASLAEWHAHRIASAVPEGGVDFLFGDAFPHDAAMDSLHGVDFRKGCYIGQEVVSRMRHRGTARRRIVALAAGDAFPDPGADILGGERPLGRLGSSANGRAVGLVRLDRMREALDAGLPVSTGAVALSVSLPAWATYDWPTAAGGED